MPEGTTYAATAVAHPNLALVKYWGYAQPALNIPANNSISITLDGARTMTSVVFDPTLEDDVFVLDGIPGSAAVARRVALHLDRVRDLAGSSLRAQVFSYNDFPAAAGMASSAAGFAALSLAATWALGLRLSPQALSILARKGSGSACRSIFGGYVEWNAGSEDASSFAHTIYSPDYWDVRVVTVGFPGPPKRVSSEEGHLAAPSSPYYAARLRGLVRLLQDVRGALRERDFEGLGMAVEREALSLHAIAMTSQPEAYPWLGGILYVEPETVRLMHAVQNWRSHGLSVYFTLDAGPTVHLLCQAGSLEALLGAIRSLPVTVEPQIWVSEPGPGAWLVSDGDNV